MTAKASSFLQIRHLVSATSGRRHLGVIIFRLQCDRIRKGKGGSLEGQCPCEPLAQIQGSQRGPVCKGDQYKGHKGPPDRGRQPADINPTHVPVPESDVFRIPDGRLHAAAHGWRDAANVAWRNAAELVAVSAESPGGYVNPNSPHTPTWGDDDELAETKPSPPPLGTGMSTSGRDGAAAEDISKT